MIKAQVLNRLADAADPFVQVMVDIGTELKEFESAMFDILLQAGLQLLKRSGRQFSVDTLEKVSRRMGHAASEVMHQKPASPTKDESQFLVLTANGKGMPLVKPRPLRRAAFEGKAVRPGSRRIATIAMSRAAREIELSRKPNQILIRQKQHVGISKLIAIE